MLRKKWCAMDPIKKYPMTVASTFGMMGFQFRVFVAVGLKASMPPACNKCKQGLAQEGDSWCLGCSSLELSQGLLKQQWKVPGLRAVVEETLLSSARLVRAFANLDHSLPQGGAAGSDRAPATAAKVRPSRPRRSRSPHRDERPLLPRSPARIAKAEPSEHETEETFDEEEEEEDTRPDTEVAREHRRPDRPPEPEGPPPGRTASGNPPAVPDRRPPPREEGHKSRKKKRDREGGRRRRGGTKHQKRFKDLVDPFRRSHRRLKGDILELSQSFEDGLARRF